MAEDAVLQHARLQPRSTARLRLQAGDAKPEASLIEAMLPLIAAL